jgi:hypothetical protein
MRTEGRLMSSTPSGNRDLDRFDEGAALRSGTSANLPDMRYAFPKVCFVRD